MALLDLAARPEFAPVFALFWYALVCAARKWTGRSELAGQIGGYIHALTVIAFMSGPLTVNVAAGYFIQEFVLAATRLDAAHFVHGIICTTAMVYGLVYPHLLGMAVALLSLEVTTPLMHLSRWSHMAGYRALSVCLFAMFGLVFFLFRVVLYTAIVYDMVVERRVPEVMWGPGVAFAALQYWWMGNIVRVGYEKLVR